MSTRVVDIHAHLLVPSVEALVAGRPERVDALRQQAEAGGGASTQHNRQLFANDYLPKLTDVATRLAAMDRSRTLTCRKPIANASAAAMHSRCCRSHRWRETEPRAPYHVSTRFGPEYTTMAKQTRDLSAAFGGVKTTLAEQREIWVDALDEDAIWEGPTFETPIYIVGRRACGFFMELLLEVVPKFSTQLIAAYPTSEPDTVIIESTGGGDTIFGGKYEQRYFSKITSKNGKAFRMREYCNPFQTYKAFGKERWESRIATIMKEYNAPWPASQAPDPARLPGT